MKLQKLKDVCSVNSGISPPKDKKIFENGTVPFYKTLDVGRIKIGDISDSELKVSQEFANSKRVFEPGTILFPKSGASTLLNHRVMIQKKGLVASTLAAIVPIKDLCLSKYLFYYLLTIDTKDFIPESFYPGMKISEISEIPIPVPSLQEQEKIVERLDKVFNNINAILRKNDLKKKLYSDYFESIAWEEVIENQKFAKNPISDFFELDPSKSEILNENLDEVSFIPMADVDELVFEVESKQIKNYKQVKKGYKYFANGDFLLAKITPCFENGKMGQVNNLKNKIGFGSTEFIVHRSKGKILNEWLFLLYSNSRIRKKLASTMSGAVGHKRISKETISNLQICSPTIEEQKKIIDKLFMIKKIVDKKISIIDKETVKYSSLKKSILDKEFSYE
jgi:type I restriction enzyme S subunit